MQMFPTHGGTRPPAIGGLEIPDPASTVGKNLDGNFLLRLLKHIKAEHPADKWPKARGYALVRFSSSPSTPVDAKNSA